MSDSDWITIEPDMSERHYWRDLWRFRELFYVLAWRDIAVRYKQTIIGLAWALIQPFLTMVVFTVIFGTVAKLPSDGQAPYALLVYAALLPWQLFSSSLSGASASLISNANLVSKVYFPRLIVPASAVVVAFVDFLISFVILIGLMAWFQYAPDWPILTLPLFVLMALLASLGPGLLITALNVKYRDFRYVIPFLIQFGLYVSPVGFSSALVPDEWRLLFSLNPDGWRHRRIPLGNFGWWLSHISTRVCAQLWGDRFLSLARHPPVPENGEELCRPHVMMRPSEITMHSQAIQVENLGKSYFIGHNAERSDGYLALRDVLSRSARNLVRTTGDLFAGRPIIQGDEVEEFRALNDVSFQVGVGERVGIIGRNGAGKSTLLKVLSRITHPSRGRVRLNGRVASLLEVGTGFHPELTGRENIFLNGAILGMSRGEIQKKFDEIVAFAEVSKFLDTPVKRYSSGMYVRLAFAVAAHLESEILIVDEVLAVGDANFQRKCLGVMADAGKGGRTVLFVSHNLAAIQNLCNRTVVLEKGRVVFDGSATDGINQYLTRSNDAVTTQSLEQHPGRPASARKLLTSLVIHSGLASPSSASKEFTTGDAVYFDIGYDAGGESFDYLVIGVSSLLNDRILTVGTHISNPDIGPLTGRGVVQCKIDNLPLAPGEYSVLVAAGHRSSMTNVDYIEDAARLRVAESDFYGTGLSTLPGQGTVAVRSHWGRVEE